jgi:hypothetical protein
MISWRDWNEAAGSDNHRYVFPLLAGNRAAVQDARTVLPQNAQHHPLSREHRLLHPRSNQLGAENVLRRKKAHQWARSRQEASTLGRISLNMIFKCDSSFCSAR